MEKTKGSKTGNNRPRNVPSGEKCGNEYRASLRKVMPSHTAHKYMRSIRLQYGKIDDVEVPVKDSSKLVKLFSPSPPYKADRFRCAPVHKDNRSTTMSREAGG